MELFKTSDKPAFPDRFQHVIHAATFVGLKEMLLVVRKKYDRNGYRYLFEYLGAKPAMQPGTGQNDMRHIVMQEPCY